MVSNELLERLGVEIKPELVELALTHSSFAYENQTQSNERLEFLGDSVLGYVVASYVYQKHSDLSEGDLTRLKNSIVSANALAVAANHLDLGKHLLLGKGELATGGRQRLNILADAMEAIIGAVYLTGGIESAAKLIEHSIIPLLDDPVSLRELADPKTTLLEKLKDEKAKPEYEVSFEGPEHNRMYFAKCYLAGELLGQGEGTTIRSAETSAALAALRTIANR
ncbi:MAG: ribonuclease III [Actinobacteria bacterium]|uniref:ribonuclease III n=1 Tax=freshwater metagenome TaxID=449393 RepID=A0A6J6BMN4_9ZZZZ|nr:ribonuclease III [Actinomycetota bacterium]MTA89453.1 ribonuclease III [Actinomycetota bacterium]